MAKKAKEKKMMGHRSRHDPSGIGVPIEPNDARETKKEAKKKAPRKMTRRAARR